VSILTIIIFPSIAYADTRNPANLRKMATGHKNSCQYWQASGEWYGRGNDWQSLTRKGRTMKTKNLTTNQHYGGLNRRFARRAALLRRLRFNYVANEFGAFFVRGSMGYNKPRIIPACVLSLADKRTWFDKLRTALA
jgi:hypothetical protein